MPQTLRTANDIIVRAFYLIGEVSPNETPTSDQVLEGLYYLNDLFDHFASLGIYIPFISELSFTMTPGKDKYTISNILSSDILFERIVELDFVNVIRNEISYPLRIINRAELFQNSRLTNLEARPGYVILERRSLESELHFYPVPAFAYECKVRAKFMLDHVELFDTFDEVPPYYNRFLRYALARELRSVYPSANWTQTAENEYQLMLKNLAAANDIELTIYPDNILMEPYGDFVYEAFGIFT